MRRGKQVHVLRLNTNNIQLHEEAIKSFQQEDVDGSRAIQRLENFRQKHTAESARSNEKNAWIHERRKLNGLEATALKQMNEALGRVECMVAKDENSISSTCQDEIEIINQVEGMLTALKDAYTHVEPTCMANYLIQAREELAAIGGDIDEECDKAAVEATEARTRVTELLRADLNDQEFPSQLKAKIDTLKTSLCAGDAAALTLEADIVERFAAVQRRYEQRIATGNVACNLAEATAVLKRQRQEATKWALKRVDEAIARESSRQQQAALAAVQKTLTEESRSRLKVLREAREKVASAALQQKAKDQLDEKERESSLKALREEERAQSKAAVEQWKEEQRRDEERKQIEAYQQRYQVELDRLQRMDTNSKRVSYRKTILLGKLKSRRKLLEEAARAEEIRFEKLSQLAATVPYYDDIIQVKSNIHGTTAARKNDVYTGDTTGLADFQHGKLHSFTNERIFADKNFRLGHALHESGAAKSAAARDAVRAFIPREKAIWEHCP